MSILDRLRDLIVRVVIKNTDDTKRLRTIQAAFFDDELQEGIEHFEPFGFTSRPLNGAEALILSLAGNRGHAIAAVITDRRYRVKELNPGEVCVFDNKGRKVFFKASGIEIDGVSSPVTIKTSGELRISASKVVIDCDVEASGDVKAGTISLQNHKHSGVEPGSGTSGGPV